MLALIGNVTAYASSYTETYETLPGGTGYAAILSSPNGLTYDTYDSRAFRRLAPYPNVIVIGSGDENLYWGNNGILPAPLYGEPGTFYCDDNSTNYLFNGYGTGYYVEPPDEDNDFILGINFTNGPTHVYGASLGYASGSNAPTHYFEMVGFNSDVEVWSVGANVNYEALTHLTIPETNDPVDRIEIVRNNNLTGRFGHLPLGWYTIDDLIYEISGEPTGGYEWKYYTEAEYRYGYFFDEEMLPVQLSSFTANCLNGKPTLYWNTQSETDNIGWNIYRAKNDDNFVNASQINNEMITGYGSTSEPHYYIYEDEIENTEVGDTYYYWLESIDYSGISQVYNRVAQVTIPDPSVNPPNLEPPIVYDFKNVPNPVNTSSNFQFTLDKASLVSVSIYNIKGELVRKLPSVLTQEDETSIIYWNGKDNSGKDLSPGVYFYNLIVNGKIAETKKLILMK